MAAIDQRTRLIEALENAAPAELDVVDVELAGASRAPLLRVYLDHASPEDGPIDLGELAKANSWVDAAVEETGLFSGPFTLEVSSPGLARPLRRERDFARYVGERAQVKMAGFSGRRSYTGEIVSVGDGALVLEVDGERFELPLESVQKAQLQPDYDDL